jgi:hypothetical protein
MRSIGKPDQGFTAHRRIPSLTACRTWKIRLAVRIQLHKMKFAQLTGHERMHRAHYRASSQQIHPTAARRATKYIPTDPREVPLAEEKLYLGPPGGI